MARARRTRSSFAASLGSALAALIAASTVAADTCPFPLGDHLVTGDVRIIDGSYSDPEYWATDTTWFGVTFSEGRFATNGSRVSLVYEAEYEYLPYNETLKTESHIVAYKEFSTATGWDTRPVFLSSADVEQPLSQGPATYPTVAGVGDDVWVAWSVSGHTKGTSGFVNPVPFWPSLGTYIVARGNRNGTWGPIEPLSDLGPVSVNVRPVSTAPRAGAYFAYQSNARETLGEQFHILGRPFDGRNFGPIEEVSTPQDGWTDETVTLGSDGSRVAAVWTQRNATDFANGSTRVVLRVREPSGAWSDPVEVAPPGERDVTYPVVAWHDNKWYVGWSAIDAAASPGGDSSILLRAFDPLSHSTGPILYVTNATSPGFDSAAALISYGGLLHVAWNSNSVLGSPSAPPADLDAHMRTWDGTAFSQVTQMDQRAADREAALWPGFLRVGTALFATYGLNLVNNTLGEHNQRQVIRLLERTARAEDVLSATYSIRPGSFLGNGTARVNIRFQQPGRTANASDHYAIALGDGTLIRLPPGFAEGNISIPFRDNKFYGPSHAYWCGEPLSLQEVAWPFPPPPPPPIAGTLTALAPLIALAVAIGYVGLRMRRSRTLANSRRAPAPGDSKEEAGEREPKEEER